ncbi:hypothetical protein [Jeotgalibaca caeni]|uniref:hypothetical protein n=1 Tax=Jeotgalibaca caeni TaxID=3028623 RepID=UPI00237D345C|nr:hypothetical protein [Jeotgalibaca caeni]MDE1549942.1 hypothetical protein [Jeotgalibaca caeni]
MNKGFILFFIGLIMFMSGIYLSTIWTAFGMLIGIGGGFLTGTSTFFINNEASSKKEPK